MRARLRLRVCAARAVGRKSRRVPPSGPRLRRPASEGPRAAAVYLIALRAGSGFDWGFPNRLPALCGNGRPSRSAPFGPCPVEALACATGPEGGTRRLFPSARLIDGRAPPANMVGGATCFARCRHTHESTAAQAHSCGVRTNGRQPRSRAVRSTSRTSVLGRVGGSPRVRPAGSCSTARA
jgi:hypothetical protein